MQYDIDQPVTRDPETDPGAEFKERSIGTAFDILRSVRDTCHMAKPKDIHRSGEDSHPVWELQNNLNFILDSEDVEVKFESVEEKTPTGSDNQRLRDGDDVGVHMEMSVIIHADDGSMDSYVVHINTWGGAIVGRGVTNADLHDGRRFAGQSGLAERTESDTLIPLSVGVNILRKELGKKNRPVSDVLVQTTPSIGSPEKTITIEPLVAAGTHVPLEGNVLRDRVIIVGDTEGPAQKSIDQIAVTQSQINAMNAKLVEQARMLYVLRAEAKERGITPDTDYFTPILHLLEQVPTALSA